MSEREFWWASYKGEAPQVVEIGRVDGRPDWCCFTGTDWNLNAPLDDLSLIERVLPPGRVAVAVSKLREAQDTGDAQALWRIAEEAIAILQGEAAAGA